MHQYTRFIGAVFLSALVAACSGGGTGAGGAIPSAPDSQPQALQGDPSLQQQVSPDQAPVSDSSTTSTATLSTMSTVGVPAHVLTGDYFGTPWGTTSVAPSRAVPYLNWVRTAASNGDRLSAAGFKVQVYSNATRIQSSDPMYRMTAASGFARTCSGSRVYDVFKGITQYVGVPASAALKSSYGELVRGQMARGHIDAMFEDNAGALADFGEKFYSSLPCGYSDTAWIAGEAALQDSLPVGTIFNGLSAFHNHGVSLSVALMNNPKTLGGEIEHCFTDDSHVGQGSWPWVATENTQIQVTEKHKIFQCQAVRTSYASENAASRIYALASFELTYNPSYSVLFELYRTPSGLHVMPESRFVATRPLRTVSSVAELRQSGGAYVREYAACYYAGRLIGRCAMAVNPDYYAHDVSLIGFHHTLAVRGDGVLDGGTVSFAGAAPPRALGATSAVIALP